MKISSISSYSVEPECYIFAKMIKQPFKITKAGMADLSWLMDLARNTFIESWMESENEADINSYVNENFNATRILNELQDETVTYLIVEANDQKAGYIKLQRNDQPEGHQLINPIAIHRLYIRKELQGLKLGTQLIKEAKFIAQKENFKYLWLGVWNKNMGAIRLYEKMGFSIFGTYKFVMGSEVSDDYLMKVAIDESE